MTFQEENLIYNYEWEATNGDNPNYTGKNDRNKLNRDEGYEILHFVQAYCKSHSLKKIEDGQKVEWMIQEKVPSDIQNRKEIELWIEENWNKYQPVLN